MLDLILVGGSRLLRGGMKLMLEQCGSRIVAEYDSIEDVKARDGRDPARSVYLLHAAPQRRSLRDEIAALRRADPEARIAVMLPELAADALVDVFAAGGDGVLLEDIPAPALNESLKLIELGEKVFPSQLATLLSGDACSVEKTAASAGAPLTPRELEIVRCLTRGMSNKEIAIKLKLAVATVKVHVKSMLKKLGLQNRTQAAIWAVDSGLVGPPRVTLAADGTISTEPNSDPRTSTSAGHGMAPSSVQPTFRVRAGGSTWLPSSR